MFQALVPIDGTWSREASLHVHPCISSSYPGILYYVHFADEETSKRKSIWLLRKKQKRIQNPDLSVSGFGPFCVLVVDFRVLCL